MANGPHGSDEGAAVVDEVGHVVAAPDPGARTQATLADGYLHRACLVGTDSSTDLAILTLDDPPRDDWTIQGARSWRAGAEQSPEKRVSCSLSG